MPKQPPILHLVYSTNWKWYGDPSANALGQAGAVPRRKRRRLSKTDLAMEAAMQHLYAQKPACCDMTGVYFRELLAKEARARGMQVVRWPISGRSKWLAFGEAVRSGRTEPGAAAVLLHSWYKGYEKECVPAWEFYPILEEVATRHSLLYPSAALDRLHSEKRYTSSLMAPTVHLHFSRQPDLPGGWQISCDELSNVDSSTMKDVSDVVSRAVGALASKASSAGLKLNDVMMKQGLSWGGEAVIPLAPSAVPRYIVRKVLPSVPRHAETLTILLQAKVDIVSELRWVILNGELRGRAWKTFKKARRGHFASTARYKSEEASRESLKHAGLAADDEGCRKMEESLRHKVEQVLSEATADAGGEVPQFLRVDFIVDAQGRAWLGERESWGADLNQGHNPSKSEVAKAIVERALRSFTSRSACSRRHLKQGLAPKPSRGSRAKLQSAAGPQKKRRLRSDARLVKCRRAT